MITAPSLLRRCGAPSRWRWAEPCRQPPCPKCFSRFVDREISRAVDRYGETPAPRLGWFSIGIGCAADVPILCERTTNRFRNIIDRERRRFRRWYEIDVKAQFGFSDGSLLLAGLVYLADVRPEEFSRVVGLAWTVEAVEVAPFSGEDVGECIRSFGSQWHAGPHPAFTSFRSMRLMIGPRFMKRTRHSPPATDAQSHLEPMPVTFSWA